MNARNLFIACGIHANRITEQAAEKLLAYNREQNRGLWAKGQEHGEHVPVWTYALRTDGDYQRLVKWIEGHKAHGAKRITVAPINSFNFSCAPMPEVAGLKLTASDYARNRIYAFSYSRV